MLEALPIGVVVLSGSDIWADLADKARKMGSLAVHRRVRCHGWRLIGAIRLDRRSL
jgi:hypothetical protein